MSPITNFSLLALASCAVAVPFHGHHSHHIHPTGDGHHINPSGTEHHVYPRGTVIPYGAGNGTVWGTASAPYHPHSQYSKASMYAGPQTASSSISAVAAVASSGGCGADSTVIVTATNKVTMTVTDTLSPTFAAPTSEAATSVAPTSEVATSEAASSAVPTSEAATYVVPTSEVATSAGYSTAEFSVETSVATSAASSAVVAATSAVQTSAASSAVVFPVPSAVSYAVAVSSLSSSAPASSAVAASTVASSAAASSTTSAALTSNTGAKRGIVYSDASSTTPFDDSTAMGWAYNWLSSPGSIDDKWEFVPMLHSGDAAFTASWEADWKSALGKGSKNFLAFNEPDISTQANMSPDQCKEDYITYMNPIKTADSSARLGAPAVTNGQNAAKTLGLDFLGSFMQSCGSSCQIDFVPIHWYSALLSTTVDDFKTHLQSAHTLTNKPVWVTEFGLTGSSDADIQSFMEAVLPWMDSQDWVERYSYYMAGDGYLLSGTQLSSYGSTYVSAS